MYSLFEIKLIKLSDFNYLSLYIKGKNVMCRNLCGFLSSYGIFSSLTRGTKNLQLLLFAPLLPHPSVEINVGCTLTSLRVNSAPLNPNAF